MDDRAYAVTALTARAIERIRTLPEFRRAREYRLYTGDGRRYLDLWQEDGHAAGGHRSGGWREVLSNKLSRGLSLPLPGPEAQKLRQAVRTWISLEVETAGGHVSMERRPVYLFRDERARANALFSLAPDLRIRDALCSLPGGSARAVLVRAFSAPRLASQEWLLPVLPLPQMFAVSCLIGPEGASRDSRLVEDLVAPAILAAGARAVYDVCRMLRSGTHPGSILAADLQRSGVWAACGPWLLPSVGDEQQAYDRLFAEHAANNIVLNPVAGAPSLVPAVVSKGERDRILGAAERARSCGLGR